MKLWEDTANQLKGRQVFAQDHLGWSRSTIQKGAIELATGQDFQDQFHLRGRKKAEERPPQLLDHIQEIVEPTSQTDPTFRSTRSYTPITAGMVRQKLISQFKYKDKTLPCERTILNKLNQLGYHPMKVHKCNPLKTPETDVTFDQVHRINCVADLTKGILELSMDAKATLGIGDFSRRIKCRQKIMHTTMILHQNKS
ncbi:ISAzo13-like element transposase-related protein [Pelagibaculum spongiae]|uniref:Uncharacterized protein n=1 Tax=Pelagibaculum spongiae TaxID=2080658 RepID=A0A2V1GUF0_9GAMM|nr:hypothetical protein [Pelagibaculum spongiae]PVZ69639.1 hypothetical protein DC094_10055 [Pelagibaculum spongiae]